jgi:hypothetical protein
MTPKNSTAMAEQMQRARVAVSELHNTCRTRQREHTERAREQRVQRLRDIGWDQRADQLADGN